MNQELSSVFCIVKSDEKHEAIDEIIASCDVFEALPEKARFIKAVHRRERLQSTGIGHGVAIAHGKVPGLEMPIIAFGLSREGIVFDDRYPDPVRMIFVIASSPAGQTDYLKAVASILTWVHDPDFRARLSAGNLEDDDVRLFIDMLRSQEFSPRYERCDQASHHAPQE